MFSFIHEYTYVLLQVSGAQRTTCRRNWVLAFHHVEVPGIELGSLGLPPTHLADPNFFFLESGCHVAQANSELTV